MSQIVHVKQAAHEKSQNALVNIYIAWGHFSSSPNRIQSDDSFGAGVLVLGCYVEFCPQPWLVTGEPQLVKKEGYARIFPLWYQQNLIIIKQVICPNYMEFGRNNHSAEGYNLAAFQKIPLKMDPTNDLLASCICHSSWLCFFLAYFEFCFSFWLQSSPPLRGS